MRLVRARLHRFALPLRRPMETAHGALALRSGFLVEVEDEGGVRGFGEATPLPDFGTEDEARCLGALRAGLRDLLHAPPASASAPGAPTREGPLAGALRVPAPDAPLAASPTPCADFALETACADLAARRAGCRLADGLAAAMGRPRPGDWIPSQVVVSGREPEAVARATAASRRAGATTYKLKVALDAGSGDGARPEAARDVERVAALREAAGAGARLRLDANEGWSEPEAERALEALARFRIDYVEQPVAREAIDALARLSAAGVIDVAADEALQGAGWLACLERRAASIWILKPAALGGLGLAAALTHRARAAGLRTVWSTLVDGAVGRAATAALAAALGQPGEVHGLGTASWLAKDLCPDDGSERADRVRLRPGSGLGLAPEVDATLSRGAAERFDAEAAGGGAEPVDAEGGAGGC